MDLTRLTFKHYTYPELIKLGGSDFLTAGSDKAYGGVRKVLEWLLDRGCIYVQKPNDLGQDGMVIMFPDKSIEVLFKLTF